MKGKSGEQIKWDYTLDQLRSFVSFVLKSKGKWKQTGKSDKSDETVTTMNKIFNTVFFLCF